MFKIKTWIEVVGTQLLFPKARKFKHSFNNDVGLGTNSECQDQRERDNEGRVMRHIFPNIYGENPT